MAYDSNSFVDMLLQNQQVNPQTGTYDADPWAALNGAGEIAPLPGVQLDAAPQLNADPNQFNSFQDMISGKIGSAYDFPTAQAQTALIDNAPQAATSQFEANPVLQDLINGQGFSPSTLAYMRTQAMEAPAMAGRQQMSQMKSALGQAGISGPASAAYLGDVARNTGYQQGQNLQNVAIQNALQGSKNQQFGLGLDSQIGMTNMQQANMMALQNANMMFQALRDNQQAQNNMNQFNANTQQNQNMAGAAAQGSYAANAGNLSQQQAQANATENANKDWGREIQNTTYDWNKQVLPWQEQNQRFQQAAGTLGSWGQ